MRIWSIHPKYLDAKGLVALWRETLLAKHVLQGKTKGYKNHPQLNRFKVCIDPVCAIDIYLTFVLNEAESRGYNFDASKIQRRRREIKIPVTIGQLAYEKKHLLSKLKVRDPEKFRQLQTMEIVEVHPLFRIIEGGVEEWEITR